MAHQGARLPRRMPKIGLWLRRHGKQIISATGAALDTLGAQLREAAADREAVSQPLMPSSSHVKHARLTAAVGHDDGIAVAAALQHRSALEALEVCGRHRRHAEPMPPSVDAARRVTEHAVEGGRNSSREGVL